MCSSERSRTSRRARDSDEAPSCGAAASFAATPSCSFSIVQPAITFGPEGGTDTATVAAGSACAWTSTSSASFLAVTVGASGTGNGTVQFTVAVNTGAERTGTLSIAGATITITQRAATC